MNPFISVSYMHCRRQCIEVRSADWYAQSTGKFFTFIFQLFGLALIAPLHFALHY